MSSRTAAGSRPPPAGRACFRRAGWLCHRSGQGLLGRTANFSVPKVTVYTLRFFFFFLPFAMKSLPLLLPSILDCCKAILTHPNQTPTWEGLLNLNFQSRGDGSLTCQLRDTAWALSPWLRRARDLASSYHRGSTRQGERVGIVRLTSGWNVT